MFDLLSALLDSWSLWNEVAGSEEAGQRWRGAYLASTCAEGAYRDYETLIAEAALSAGLAPSCARELVRRHDELRPWPGATEVLLELRGRVKTAVVTNCSEALGRRAVVRLGSPMDAVVTAERAGFYKPDSRPYALALHELDVPASRALFVAGSAYDLMGAPRLGLGLVWHNPLGLALPQAIAAQAAAPLAEIRTLEALPPLVLGPGG